MKDYVEAAIRKNIKEICFTDHLGRYYLNASQRKRFWDWGMPEQHLDIYFEDVQQAIQTYKDQCSIKIGLEIDYIEGVEDTVLSIISRYPLDFILGSVHCLPRFGWKHLAHYNTLQPKPLFIDYFHTIQAAIRSGLFNGLAHLDFIWRYIKWPDEYKEEILGYLADSVRSARSRGIAIEINANGYLWSLHNLLRDCNPFDTMIDLIRENHVAVTYGSDAHKPENVGSVLMEIGKLLLYKGITSYSTFEKGKRVDNPIILPDREEYMYPRMD